MALSIYNSDENNVVRAFSASLLPHPLVLDVQVHMFYECDGLVRDTEHPRLTDPESEAL